VVVLTQAGAIVGQLQPATAATIYALMGADTISSALPLSDGRFKLAALPVGTYKVGIDVVSGYRDTTLNNVVVAVGDTTNVGTVNLVPAIPQ
jgi:hypothetical protein